ncbi:MAG: ribonuclease Z [Chitinophagaceae bacterium]
MLAVTILGNNSALPAFDRHPTSQVVTLNDHLFLVDCGEGTQMQIAKYRIKRSRIHDIFISHLHGDHYFGLMGLITSMGLLGRVRDLNIFAPAPLKEIIELQLKAGSTILPFALCYHVLEEGVMIQEEKFEVSCFKVFHRIDCWGFIFREKKPPRKLDGDKIKQYNIPISFYEQLRWGQDYVTGTGAVVTNDLVTEPSPKGKSYAYAADTLYEESIACKVKGVDLLYHETTYLDELRDRAAKRFHCTTVQAAHIAKIAGVHRLLIGHFSSKYEKLEEFEIETRTIFPNTDLALEGVSYMI